MGPISNEVRGDRALNGHRASSRAVQCRRSACLPRLLPDADDPTLVAGGPEWRRLAGLAPVAAAAAVGLARRRCRHRVPAWLDLAGRGPLPARRGRATSPATPTGTASPSVLLYALGVQMADAPGITTDGAIYFSQLRSLVFDRDLDVAREFAYLGQPPRPSHFVPIGPTLFWLPLYLAVAVVDAVAARGRPGRPPPGDAVALGLTLPVRPGRADQLVRRRRRRPRERARPAAPRSRPAGGVRDHGAGVRRDAAGLVHGLRGVDDARRVVRRGRRCWCSPRCAGSRPARLLPRARPAGSDGWRPLAFLMRPQEALFAAVPAVLAAMAGAASAGSVPSALLATLPRRARSAPRRGWPCRRCTARCSLRANDFQLFGQQGYLDPLAIALARHAVLLVARPAVVDAGGLRRGRSVRWRCCGGGAPGRCSRSGCSSPWPG